VYHDGSSGRDITVTIELDTFGSARDHEAHKLGGMLRELREAAFVGRSAELRVFERVVAPRAEVGGERAVLVHGPGGVGKSELLRAFARLAARRGYDVTWIDGGAIEATPESLLAAVDARRAEHGGRGPELLVIDELDRVEALAGWLRTDFLPELPTTSRVALASRRRPDEAWRVDPGWRAMIVTLALAGLSRDEAAELLAWRGLSSPRIREVHELTQGHPLALVLVGEVTRHTDTQLADLDGLPEVVRALVPRFVAGVPEPRHREALELLAAGRYLNEAGLAALLGDGAAGDGAADVARWLRGLPIARETRAGFALQPVVRRTLAADLRARDSDRWQRRLRQVYRYHIERLRQLGERHARDSLRELAAVLGQVGVFQESFGDVGAERDDTLALARPGDWPALAAMVARHEGPEAAERLRHWRDRSSEAAVLRDADGAPDGFVLTLRRRHFTPEGEAADPALAIAADWVRSRPPRDGQVIHFDRFWMAREAYQGPSAATAPLFAHIVMKGMLATNLAFVFSTCRDPERWLPLCDRIGHLALAGVFTSDGQRYGVMVADMRARTHFECFAEQFEVSWALAARPEPTILSREAFAGAAREALKAVACPPTLAQNPLATTAARLGSAVRELPRGGARGDPRGGAGRAARRGPDRAVRRRPGADLLHAGGQAARGRLRARAPLRDLSQAPPPGDSARRRAAVGAGDRGGGLTRRGRVIGWCPCGVQPALGPLTKAPASPLFDLGAVQRRGEPRWPEHTSTTSRAEHRSVTAGRRRPGEAVAALDRRRSAGCPTRRARRSCPRASRSR